MSVNNSPPVFANGILKYGTEEQKQKYVRAIATGEQIGAYALTESSPVRMLEHALARGAERGRQSLPDQRTQVMDYLRALRPLTWCCLRPPTRKRGPRASALF